MNTKLRALTLWTFVVALPVACGLPAYSGPSGAECEPCDSVCDVGLVCEGGYCIDPANPKTCRAPEELCNQYCDAVMDACPKDYMVRDMCMGVCSQLPPGDANEPAGNSVECRLNQLRVLAAGGGDPEEICQAAGPGGNGVCGTNCESYCLLVDQVCANWIAPLSNCEAACEVLGDSERFHVGSPSDEFDHAGDTVQCRLVHLSSATVDPEFHCGHADLVATQWCNEEPPSCEAYCRIVGAACMGSDAVYTSEEACLAACALFEPGSSFDVDADTVGCRTRHAKSALSAPANYCPLAGPTADGHCSSASDSVTCAPFCRVLEAACPEQFGETWENSEACFADCYGRRGQWEALADEHYSVESAEDSGASVGCRVSYAVRALVTPTDPSLCDAAFGAAPCAD